MQQVTTLEDGGNYNKCVVAVDVLAHGVSDSWCVIVANSYIIYTLRLYLNHDWITKNTRITLINTLVKW